jgi:hypothetical protein
MGGVASLGLVALPFPPGGHFDCSAAYKSFWQKLDHRYPVLSAEQIVALTRRALRVYDACQTNDLRDADAEALFERLDTRTD